MVGLPWFGSFNVSACIISLTVVGCGNEEEVEAPSLGPLHNAGIHLQPVETATAVNGGHLTLVVWA